MRYLAVATAVVLGCQTPGAPAGAGGSSDKDTSTGVEAGAVPDPGVPDPGPPADPGNDPGGDDAGTKEGGFGWPCTENADCASSLCLPHLGEEVCSKPCVDSCPEGWECKPYQGGGADVKVVCVSKFTHLCRPCQVAADCKSDSGVEDVCVRYGDQGSFCGAPCGDGCPEGYSCADAETVAGAPTTQCVADASECACSTLALELSLATDCAVSNEFGSCQGIRFCGADGLSDCDAATPAAESCNGVDDDCDGVIDNVTCDDQDDCTDDACDPTVGCVHTALDGTSCDDADVCTLADHCEAGVCVGTAIECDDGDPCTDDACSPTGGCVQEPNTAPCDDGDPCTDDDTCAQGQCVGADGGCECQQDADCAAFEDGDPCNGTLWCDQSQLPYTCVVDPETVIVCDALDAECLANECDADLGECLVVPAAENELCDDGDACTVGTACADGACVGGSVVNCADGNPCTDEACDVEAGCVVTPNAALRTATSARSATSAATAAATPATRWTATTTTRARQTAATPPRAACTCPTPKACWRARTAIPARPTCASRTSAAPG